MKDLQSLHEQFMTEQRYSTRQRDATLNSYKTAFDTFLKIMPEITLKELNSRMMTEFFRRLETRERRVGSNGHIKKKGVKKSTIATYRSKLNTFFKWLRATGKLKESPFLGIAYPEVNYNNRSYLKKEQVEKIFTAVGYNIDWKNSLVRKRNYAICTILLNDGIRKGELLGLRLYDVDMQRKLLYINGETSKSKISRAIPLNSKAIQALEDYIDERKKYGCKTEYLWVSTKGDEALTADGLKHMIETIIKFTGIKFHLHQFRHTFAVNVLNGGSDISRVKQLMGHKDIRMTCAYLRQLPSSMLRADVELINLATLI